MPLFKSRSATKLSVESDAEDSVDNRGRSHRASLISKLGIGSSKDKRRSGSANSAKRYRSPSPGIFKRSAPEGSRSPSPPLSRRPSEDDSTDTESLVNGSTGSSSQIVPQNAYDDEEDDDDDDGWDEFTGSVDPLEVEVFRNTSINTGDRPVMNILESQSRMPQATEDHGNMLLEEAPVFFVPPEPSSSTAVDSPSILVTRPSIVNKKKDPLTLNQSPPIFERNRCTVQLTHGEPDTFAQSSRHIRQYLVASDLSEESQYAVEWAIGTVLRDGDSATIVSVMETDAKLDFHGHLKNLSADKNTPTEDPATYEWTNKRSILAEREKRATMLAIQALAFLKRTRLHVKIQCQAIHAHNAKHMLVDMIDYVEPTLVIIGSRGLTKIKGMLLGSVSYYLVQKSSVPVMVARRRLTRQSKARKELGGLNRHARVPLSQAEIERESTAGEVNAESLDRAVVEKEAQDEQERLPPLLVERDSVDSTTSATSQLTISSENSDVQTM